jgi:hypothetical protein
VEKVPGSSPGKTNTFFILLQLFHSFANPTLIYSHLNPPVVTLPFEVSFSKHSSLPFRVPTTEIGSMYRRTIHPILSINQLTVAFSVKRSVSKTSLSSCLVVHGLVQAMSMQLRQPSTHTNTTLRALYDKSFLPVSTNP